MRQSLRLISLSNYVFVLEISQISGIAQNVSMLITVVMRIVAVVGGEKRKGEKECCWNPEPSAVQVFLTKHKDIGASSVPPTPPTPCAGVPLFVMDHKKVPFDFSLLVHQLPSGLCALRLVFFFIFFIFPTYLLPTHPNPTHQNC